MKLDVNALRYLSKDDFRVLTAVEMGMRNHEIVPVELIDRIACLKRGGTYKVLKNLLKHKLVHHDSTKYDGFRLTYLGYDYLAISTLVKRGVFTAVGRQLGVGKESDIFEVATEDGKVLAIKLHRLGRVSFRAVKSKRDYLKHRQSYNWLYLSRLAALKEYSFMKALQAHGFPVPDAVEHNRHCVVMSLVPGYPLVQVKQVQNPDVVFGTIMDLVIRMAEHGLIHCDFNEFNIMIDDDEKVTMIDFPQMVSVTHSNAQMYFDRDVECIFKFFKKRSDLDKDTSGRPSFSSIEKSFGFLDKELEASGFTRKNQEEIEKALTGTNEIDNESDDSESDVDTEDERYIEVGIKNMGSLNLGDQESTVSTKNKERSEDKHLCNADVNNGLETLQASEKDETGEDKSVESIGHEPLHASEEEGNQDPNDADTDTAKRLHKQRRHAIGAAHGRRRPIASRNSYKDKGGKSSNSSKVQKQMGIW
ncbi:hypothetical protein IFM89_020508 [Coptis chinensis]|uniref:Serine/threonine-protein kinase RIO2 n=1 Tax=Coptis chinensis TaxID=261450 RepID=A0A835HNJ8_9MAGN|nr:hypothetical protein IFM89_020508 [Coptis chinensis]